MSGLSNVPRYVPPYRRNAQTENRSIAPTENRTARTERAWAGSVLTLKEKDGVILPEYFATTDHFRLRQEQRDINDPLVIETLREGHMVDSKPDSRRHSGKIHKLYIADHVVVVTAEDLIKDKGKTKTENSDQQQLPDIIGVTTYRHDLMGPWSAITHADRNRGRLEIDNSYLFFQVSRLF